MDVALTRGLLAVASTDLFGFLVVLHIALRAWDILRRSFGELTCSAIATLSCVP